MEKEWGRVREQRNKKRFKYIRLRTMFSCLAGFMGFGTI